jgi:hypothetical protein
MGTKDNNPYRLFIIFATIVLVVCLVGAYFAYGRVSESIFDGISALFSGLAFAGVLCALHLQSKELKLQWKEMVETKNILNITAVANKEAAETARRNLRAQYLMVWIQEHKSRYKSANTEYEEALSFVYHLRLKLNLPIGNDIPENSSYDPFKDSKLTKDEMKAALSNWEVKCETLKPVVKKFEQHQAEWDSLTQAIHAEG